MLNGWWFGVCLTRKGNVIFSMFWMCASCWHTDESEREMGRAGREMRFVCQILPWAFAALRTVPVTLLWCQFYTARTSRFQTLLFMPTRSASLLLFLPLFFCLDLMYATVSLRYWERINCGTICPLSCTLWPLNHFVQATHTHPHTQTCELWGIYIFGYRQW